jgi:hypothetical protein
MSAGSPRAVLYVLFANRRGVMPPQRSASRSIAVVARLAAALFLALTGCASHPRSDGAPPVRGDRNTITREQLEEQHFDNALDALEALRPAWLQARGPDSFNSPTQVWVYIDNVRLGDVSTLRTIPARTISFIRHYDPNDATARWGVGHGAGVIFIGSWRGGIQATPPSATRIQPERHAGTFAGTRLRLHAYPGT